MSHQLSINQRQDVHSAHMQLEGGANFLTVSMPVTFEIDTGPVSVIYEFEVCSACGWATRPDCTHQHTVPSPDGDLTASSMVWMHRPGCPSGIPPTYDLPAGLVKDYKSTFPGDAHTDCTGCLLLCPACGTDGT